eukprot:3088458-Pleurochrysis_carterae.AAC.1
MRLRMRACVCACVRLCVCGFACARAQAWLQRDEVRQAVAELFKDASMRVLDDASVRDNVQAM